MSDLNGTERFAVGQTCLLTISDIAFGGEGVGRIDDFVVFVPFVMLGEEVEVRFTDVKKRYGRGVLLRIVKPSPERVVPRCQYFGDCGGCQYQHIDYSSQVRIKHKQISDLFQRIGGFEKTVIDPVIPCPAPYGYRNRIMIRSQWDKFKQGLNIGFIRADNRLVVDVERCEISEPELNDAILHVRKNPPPKGGIKVVLRVQPKGWEVPRDSFFQNNFHLLPQLIQTARAALVSSGVRHLVDVYCGVGFFALELADAVDSYAGVELDRLAIKAARQNALNRNRPNGEFVDGRAEDLLPALLQKFSPDRTAVLLDPPRTGCPPESLALLRATRPAQIIYVSCHPATLARDLNILAMDGVYELRRVTPLDMFPQTQHLECLADLRLAGEPKTEI